MARLLLDTHTFLWWIDDSPKLSNAARHAISNIKNECYFSMASCWEMSVKSSLGKLKLAKPIERFITEQLTANDFSILPIELRHVSKVEKLPFHHRDPFDRLLIAQAMSEKLAIVTADRDFVDYGVKVVW